MIDTSIAWGARRPAQRSLLIVAGVAAALTAIAMIWIDVPLARAIAPYQPHAIWRGLDLLEYAILWPVHPLALPIALAIGMLVTVCVPRWRRQAPAWMFVAGVHLLSRISTTYLKDWTAQPRPIWPHDKTYSFPSGHVVLFASILVPLAVLYPRTRPLLAIVAFVAAARIAVGAHWLSDTLGAITLVALWTYALGLAVRPRR